MSRPWIFVSPSSRGIGAALTQHLLRTTRHPILATARRDPAEVKEKLLASHDSARPIPASARDRLHVLPLDVTAEETVAAAAAEARALFPPKTHHLHLALAIPGILHPEKSPGQVDYDHALETYKVNTLGPLLLMKHFYDLLPRKTTDMDLSDGEQQQQERAQGRQQQQGEGQAASARADTWEATPAPEATVLPDHATWLSMGARVGSISDNRAGGWYSYRSSKTAVASLCKSLDNFLVGRSGDRALAVAFHPGTVKTDLSRGFWESAANRQLFEPAEAAEKLVGVLARLRVEQRGKCWDYKGEEVPP